MRLSEVVVRGPVQIASSYEEPEFPGGSNGRSSRVLILWVVAGVVPQQLPSQVAPCSIIETISWSKSSLDTSRTLSHPSIGSGSPLFG